MGRGHYPPDMPEVLVVSDSPNVREEVIASLPDLRILSEHVLRMQASGHCPHVSAPEETARALVDFVG